MLVEDAAGRPRIAMSASHQTTRASVAELQNACVELESANGLWSSGIIIGHEGRWILTVAHGNNRLGEILKVHGAQDDKVLEARLVRRDPRIDIALLRIVGKSAGEGVEIVRTSVEKSAPSHWWSLGFAGGQGRSDLPRSRQGYGFQRQGGSDLLVSTCRLSPGDSGGALFDDSGNLLGLHRTMERGGKFATHVPIDSVIERWPDLLCLSEMSIDNEIVGVKSAVSVPAETFKPGSLRALLASKSDSTKLSRSENSNHHLARLALQKHAELFEN